MRPTLPSLRFRYDLGATPASDLRLHRGKVRRVERGGRAGWVLTDVFGGILLGPHHLSEARGAIGIWVMPMEDLHGAGRMANHGDRVPQADEFTFLSDRECVQQSHAARFALTWHSYWHPGLWVKRYAGHVYEGYKGTSKAVAAAGHFAFPGGRWYHLLYSWDSPANRHRLYANGVLIGTENAFRPEPDLVVEPCSDLLCAGSTLFATGAVAGYEGYVDAAGARAVYEAEAIERDAAFDGHLREVYEGRGLARLGFEPSGDWEPGLECALTDPSDRYAFEVQGAPDAVRITPEGLRITTPAREPLHDFSVLDMNAGYVWSRRFFHGDLYVRYEFQTLRRGGLSLLMTHCSGMQGEDFHAIHAPRINGTMRTVCWEDVRNYHWEYYREMNDVRNDVATHAMLKNPWLHPLAFQVHGPLYPVGEWQVLEFLQEGRRIRGAINGDVVIDADDDPAAGHGPTFACGRIAIRCMTRTDLLVRNLRVLTRPRGGLRLGPPEP